MRVIGKSISDAGLKGFSAGLGRLHNLNSLALDFGYCKRIGDPGLTHLSHNLERLRSPLDDPPRVE